MNTGPMTKVSLLMVTIICLGAFFLINNNIPVQALHKEEQTLNRYDDLADLANAVRNGDEDLEEIPIQSMEASDIYDDADDNMKDCIDLAAEVGDSLTAQEVVHCVDNVNYFESKYSSNNTVPSNAITTSTSTPDTGVDNTVEASSTSDTSTDTSTSDTSTDTSTSDTSTDTSTSGDVTGDSLINELVKTGKFTEDEAKEFASQNMLSGADTISNSDDTISEDKQATNTDNTTSSSNEQSKEVSSGSNNNGNPEDYDSLTDLVDDIKNGVVDTDEISLSDFQNSGAYKGADQETQDCIDLAAKIGSNLIDYEIVRCSEDANFFKNQIANNDSNNNE